MILSLSVYYIAYAFDSCSLAYPVLRLVKGQCRPNAACESTSLKSVDSGDLLNYSVHLRADGPMGPIEYLQ